MQNILHQAGRYFILLLASVTLFAGCTPPGPRALLRGQRLVEEGKYAEAAEELRAAVRLMGTNAVAWNYLGIACHHVGQTAEAEKAYEKAKALDRDLTEAHYNLGTLFLEQNRLDRAKAEFLACTLRRTDFTNAFLKLGAVHLRLRETTAAERAFSDALKLSTNIAEAYNGLGVARVQRNRPAEATVYFRYALNQESNYSPAVLNLAVVSHQHLQDKATAIRCYEQYLELEPQSGEAQAIEAALQQLGQRRPAATPGSGSTATAPKSGASMTPQPPKEVAAGTNPPVRQQSTPGNSGLVSRVPDVTKPLPATNRTTNLVSPPVTKREPVANVPPPMTAETNFQVVRLPDEPVYRTGSDVTVQYSRYTYRNPTKPRSGNHSAAQRSFTQGYQAHQANRLPAAIQAYRAATQLDPGYYEAHYNLALAASAAGNINDALAAYENALAIRPESLDARYNFSLLLKQAGYPVDAAVELRKLVARFPNDTRLHLALANLCAQQLKLPAEAREHYLRVLQLEPRHTQAAAIQGWLVDNPK